MRYLKNYHEHVVQFNYDFIIESLILESKLVFSDKLKSVIESLPDSKIKRSILDILKTGKDLTIQQNFFDIADNKDSINFIQDRKGQ